MWKNYVALQWAKLGSCCSCACFLSILGCITIDFGSTKAHDLIQKTMRFIRKAQFMIFRVLPASLRGLKNIFVWIICSFADLKRIKIRWRYTNSICIEGLMKWRSWGVGTLRGISKPNGILVSCYKPQNKVKWFFLIGLRLFYLPITAISVQCRENLYVSQEANSLPIFAKAYESRTITALRLQ